MSEPKLFKGSPLEWPRDWSAEIGDIDALLDFDLDDWGEAARDILVALVRGEEPDLTKLREPLRNAAQKGYMCGVNDALSTLYVYVAHVPMDRVFEMPPTQSLKGYTDHLVGVDVAVVRSHPEATLTAPDGDTAAGLVVVEARPRFRRVYPEQSFRGQNHEEWVEDYTGPDAVACVPTDLIDSMLREVSLTLAEVVDKAAEER